MMTSKSFFTKALLITAIGLSNCLCACSPSKPMPPERLPDDEIAIYREAVTKITPYITLEDSAFKLSINLNEALELDIPEKYYERVKQELDYTNYIIKEEYNRKGIKIDLPEMPLSADTDKNL